MDARRFKSLADTSSITTVRRSQKGCAARSTTARSVGGLVASSNRTPGPDTWRNPPLSGRSLWHSVRLKMCLRHGRREWGQRSDVYVVARNRSCAFPLHQEREIVEVGRRYREARRCVGNLELEG